MILLNFERGMWRSLGGLVCVCVGSVWDAIMYLIYCLMMFGIKDNLLGESMDACLFSLGVLWFI